MNNNFYTRILERSDLKTFTRMIGRGALIKSQEFRYIIRASNKLTSSIRATFIQKKL